MGLDACVYCDCVEKGNLRVPPPHAELLYIDEEGSPELRSDDLSLSLEFDQWRYGNPCQHEQFWLVLHHLGNMSGINRIRWCVQQISEEPEADFPLLWTREIYSGIHTGRLSPEEAAQLGSELQKLQEADLGSIATEDGTFLRRFLEMLTELVQASRLVGKPIPF